MTRLALAASGSIIITTLWWIGAASGLVNVMWAVLFLAALVAVGVLAL